MSTINCGTSLTEAAAIPFPEKWRRVGGGTKIGRQRPASSYPGGNRVGLFDGGTCREGVRNAEKPKRPLLCSPKDGLGTL